MSYLKGPADPDAFRVKVGRYGDRWYADNLPGCDIAPATDDSWPSASIVKNAWPKFLSSWAAGEAAACAVDEYDTWKNMTRPAAIEYLRKASDRSRDRSAERGTGVHTVLENLILGKPVPQLVALEVKDWVDACKRFVDECQPELIFTEAVMISRGLGVGGTADAGLRIGGRDYFVDYKSRALDKDGKGKHAAYDDEGVQLGLYTQPDTYMIVEQDGRPVRKALPHFDGGLIITIAPDGYRLHPVDLPVAQSLARTLHSFWSAMRTSPIGKPVHLAVAAPPPAATSDEQGGPGSDQPCASLLAPPDPLAKVRLNRQNIGTRLGALDNDAKVRLRAELDKAGLTTFADTPDERLEEYVTCLSRIETCADLDEADPFVGLPGPDGIIQPRPTAHPDLLVRYESLPSDLRCLVDANKGDLPNLRFTQGSPEQLAEAEALIAKAEVMHEERKALIGSMLQGFSDDEVTALLFGASTAPNATPLAMLTEAEVERLDDVLKAIDLGAVCFAYEPNDPTVVRPTDLAADLVVDAQGSKSAALTLAKTYAASLGLPVPRSVAQAVESPLIAARLARRVS